MTSRRYLFSTTMTGDGWKEDMGHRPKHGRSPSSLPSAISPLIARDRELSEVAELLAEHRLVSVTGAGGVGKTRVAVEAAWRADGGGARFVDLAPLADPELVPQAVADALGIREQGDREVLDTLIDHLREAEMLLVLDNCEHVVSASADLVAVLLRECPGLQTLTTSRVPLGIPGEALYPLLPLPLVGVGGNAEESPAVELFLTRTREAGARLDASPTVLGEAAAICRSLDGLPLAIELAAARVRVYGIQGLRERILESSDLLISTEHGRVDRHRTLHAAMDWSYRLLSEADRGVFRALAGFAGGFGIDAAEAVCAQSPDTAGAVDQAVERLLSASLMLEGGGEADRRFSLLFAAREYAGSELERAGEISGVRDRHARFYLGLAEEAARAADTPQDTEWIRRLETEMDNLRAALEWLFATNQVEDGARLATALGYFWRVRGHREEGVRWLERAVEGRQGVEDALQADLLGHLGTMNMRMTQLTPARELLERAVALAARAGDRASEARWIHALTWVSRLEGDLDSAQRLGQQSLDIRRSIGDRIEIDYSLASLSDVLMLKGDWEGFDKIVQEIGPIRPDHPVAFAVAHLDSRAWTAFLRGRLDEAERSANDLIRRAREIGDMYHVAWQLMTLSGVAHARGDNALALDRCLEGLSLSWDLRELEAVPTALDQLAMIELDIGDAESAAGLLGAADAVRRQAGTPPVPSWEPKRADAHARVHAAVGKRFDGLRSAAEALPVADAVALGLARKRPEEGTRDAPSSAEEAKEGDHLIRRGDYWSVGFQDERFLIKDSKGLRHLARLLAHPNQEVHVLDLVAAEEGHGSGRIAHADARDAGLSLGSEPQIEAIDQQARDAYRARIGDLAEELDEAERHHDPGRAALAREEMDLLTDELSANVGLGGASRAAASSSERARMAVTKAMRAAIARLTQRSLALGGHLDTSVRTGTFCVYRPDPSTVIRWDVR